MGIKAFNHGDDFVNKFIRAVVSDSTGFDAATAVPPPPETGITATGGVISDYTSGSDIYRAHIFTSSGTFTVTDDNSAFGTDVEYVVIAGGGGSGYDLSGGGGAGGYRSSVTGESTGGGGSLESAVPVSASPGSYTITVGAGGVGRNSSGPTPLLEEVREDRQHLVDLHLQM